MGFAKTEVVSACLGKGDSCKTYGNSHAIYAKITETEDSGPIGDDTDLRVRICPIPQDGPYRLALLDGNVQGFWAGVEGRVLQAHVTNCGGVYQGHHLSRVVHEQAVEEVGILVLDGGKVEVLVDVRLARADHPQGTLALFGEVLHNMGHQAGKVLCDTLFWGERETCASWNISRMFEAMDADLLQRLETSKRRFCCTVFLVMAGRQARSVGRRIYGHYLQLTLVPHWLAQNLVATGFAFWHVLGGTFLVHLAVRVLLVAAQLVQLLRLHGLFEGLHIDGRHWVEIADSPCGRKGRALGRDGGLGGADRLCRVW